MEATDQIDRLIESRSKGREKANELEAFWRASELRVLAKQREENRTGWFAYYSHLAHSCRRRADEYEAKAEQLLQEGEHE